MTHPDDMNAILDRIAAGTYTESDIAALRQTLIVSGDRNVVQLGKYNLNIHQGRDIQVGDRHYHGSDAEAIQAIIRQLLEEYFGSKNPGIGNEKTGYVRETIYSTLFPVVAMPRYIYGVACQYNDLQAKEASQEIISPTDKTQIYPFLLRGGMLFCFQDLNSQNGPFRQLVSNQTVECYEVHEWCEDPEQKKWFTTLLTYSLNKLTGRKGLRLDKIHRRYYFHPKETGQVLEVNYRPLNQSTSTRKVVWQPITKKTKEPKPYWYHLAVSLQFHQVSDQHWCLSIRPEMRVTKNGLNPIDSKKIGSRVTHKKSRQFNYDLLGDVNFWRDFLSDGQPRIILPFGAKDQRIIISTTMMQAEIEWPGIPEKYAMPFKNVEYPEDIFSWAALELLENEGIKLTDSGEEWDSFLDEEQEFENE